MIWIVDLTLKEHGDRKNSYFSDNEFSLSFSLNDIENKYEDFQSHLDVIMQDSPHPSLEKSKISKITKWWDKSFDFENAQNYFSNMVDTPNIDIEVESFLINKDEFD